MTLQGPAASAIDPGETSAASNARRIRVWIWAGPHGPYGCAWAPYGGPSTPLRAAEACCRHARLVCPGAGKERLGSMACSGACLVEQVEQPQQQQRHLRPQHPKVLRPPVPAHARTHARTQHARMHAARTHARSTHARITHPSRTHAARTHARSTHARRASTWEAAAATRSASRARGPSRARARPEGRAGPRYGPRAEPRPAARSTGVYTLVHGPSWRAARSTPEPAHPPSPSSAAAQALGRGPGGPARARAGRPSRAGLGWRGASRRWARAVR